MPRVRLDSGSTEQTPQSPGARAQISQSTGAGGSARRARRRSRGRDTIRTRRAAEGLGVRTQDVGTGQYHPIRVEWVGVAREYQRRSGGKNLWAQPDMRHALAQYNIVAPNADPPGTETRREMARLQRDSQHYNSDYPGLLPSDQIQANLDAYYRDHPSGKRVSKSAGFPNVVDVAKSAATGLGQGLGPLAQYPLSWSAGLNEYKQAQDKQAGAYANAGNDASAFANESNADPAKVAQWVRDRTQADVAATLTKGRTGFTADELAGSLHIPLDWAQTEEAYAAGDPQAKKAVREWEQKGGKLLNEMQRQAMKRRAQKRGWAADKIDTAYDSDLIRMAYSKPQSGWSGLAQNFGADVGAYASMPAGVVEGATSVEQSVRQGSAVPALTFLKNTFVDPNVAMAKGLATNPGGTLYDHPFFAPTFLLALAKGGDAVLSKTPGVRYAIPESWKDPRRVVTTPSGKQIDLGPAARGPVQRAIQRIAENRVEQGKATFTSRPVQQTGNFVTRRITTADEAVLRRRAIDAGQAVQNETNRGVLEKRRALDQAVRKLKTDELAAVIWADNYGTTPAGLAEAFRHYAGTIADRGGDPKLPLQMASVFERLQPRYDKLMSTEKGRRRVDAVRRQAAALSVDAEASLRRMGIDPIDLRNQAALAHPREVAAAVDAARAAHNAEAQTLRSATKATRKDARAAIREIRLDANRSQGEAARIIRASKSEKVRAAGEAALAAERAVKKQARALVVEEAKLGREKSAPNRIDHVDVANGQIRGTSRPRRFGKDNAQTAWDLRPGLSVVKTQIEGADVGPVKEGAVRGFRERFVVVIGTKGDRAVATHPDGSPRSFATASEAVAYARRLDGVDTNQPAAKVQASPKYRAVKAGKDKVGALEAQLNDPNIAFDLDRAKVAEDIRAAQSTPYQRASAAYDAAMRSLADTYDRLAQERQRAGEASPESDALIAKARDLRARADEYASMMRGRAPRDPISVGENAPPAVGAYAEARNAEIAHRDLRKSRIERARQDVANQIAPGDTAFIWTRHTTSKRQPGVRHGTPRSNPWSTHAQSMVGGRDQKRMDTLYKQGRVNVDPYHVIEDVSQPQTAEGITRGVQEMADTAGRVVNPGDRIDTNAEVVIQIGGKKLNIHQSVADAKAAADLATQTEDLLFGREPSPDVISGLYDAVFRVKDDALVHHPDGSVSVKPEAGDFRVVPASVWKDWKDRQGAQIAMNRGAWHKAMKAWRIVALNTSPATAIRNSIGSFMFPMMKGSTPLDFVRGWQMMKNGEAPNWLLGRGVVGAERTALVDRWMGRTEVPLPGGGAVRPLRPAAVYMDFLRSWNALAEDYARVVIAVTEAKKVARSDQGALTNLATRLGKTQEAYNHTVAALMDRSDPRWHDLMRETNRWLGDMSKISPLDAKLGNVVAFHKWYAHMLQLTLWTMPVHYPGRTVFIQNLADEGRRYLKEHGVWPGWMADSIIVSAAVLPALGKRQQEGLIAQLAPTSGWNVLATVPQLVGSGTDQGASLTSGLAALAPPFQLAATAALGRDPGMAYSDKYAYDANGNPILTPWNGGDVATWARLVGNRAVRLFPPANVIWSQSGYPDTAVGPFGRDRRLLRNSDGSISTHPELYPPLPDGGVLGMLERAVGLNIKPYAVGGTLGQREVQAEIARRQRAAGDQKTRDRRSTRAERARQRLEENKP